MTFVVEWGGWSAPSPGRFTPGINPVPVVQEAGWAPGPVWACAKNLAPTRIQSPDYPARSQSLYRLSYPAHRTVLVGSIISDNVNTTHAERLVVNVTSGKVQLLSQESTNGTSLTPVKAVYIECVISTHP
jgi:hypothetical protein